jgi:sporulation protein YlmC with PRC-barrel domain
MSQPHTSNRGSGATPLAFAPISRLLGALIVDVNGATVGRVSEVLIDRKDGRIAYVQFYFPGDSARCDSMITVPWSSVMSPTPSNSSLQLRVGKSALVTLRASRPS